MTISRRDFLETMFFIAPALFMTAGCAAMTRSALPHNEKRDESSENEALNAEPVITNYNTSGRALIIEGKTLLMAIKFPSIVKDVTGSLPILIEPESAGGQTLTEPQPLYFYPAGDGRTFRTILSAPLDAVEGLHNLQISARTERGASAQWTFPYRVEHGIYPNKVLTLDENFSSPTPEIAARMRRDFETMVEIYKRRTERKWRAPFVQPVLGPDRNNFGDKRTVNRTKRYRHAGLDYRAPMRTPVRAINDGTVVLSTEQWTPGQTVCLDHGGGIFSKYIHLSERRVNVGETVTRGQVIGLSGNTGGQKPPPHLHLDLTINGARIDPKDFMNTAARMLAVEAG